MDITKDGTPTETELNKILILCINKYVTVNRDKERLRNIQKILKTEGVGITIKQKFEMAAKIVDSLLDGKTVEYTINNLLANKSGKFYQYKDFIESIYDDPRGYEIQDDALECINLRLMEHNLNLNSEIFQKYIEYVTEGKHYDSVTEAWEGYEKVFLEMKKSYESARKDLVENDAATLGSDDDSEFQDQIRNRMFLKYDVTKKIPTGYKNLDDILLGGYEKQSLYIYGGNPGSGKSTMLINQLYNASLYSDYKLDLKDRYKLFVYISVENSSMQTTQRMICLHNGITNKEVISHLKKNEKPLGNYFDEADKNKSKIIMYHKNSKSITPADIEILIENAMERFKEHDPVLCAVYIDYLDQLKSDNESKEHRLNIEYNCQMLKNLAVNLDVPIITATQLNRESFNIKSAKELSSKLIAESMGPVRIADFVALMAVIDDNRDNVYFKITKNRDGESGYSFDFPVDFSISKFKTAECMLMDNDVQLSKNSNDELNKFDFSFNNDFSM